MICANVGSAPGIGNKAEGEEPDDDDDRRRPPSSSSGEESESEDDRCDAKGEAPTAAPSKLKKGQASTSLYPLPPDLKAFGKILSAPQTTS
jgi:hypothetical protein